MKNIKLLFLFILLLIVITIYIFSSNNIKINKSTTSYKPYLAMNNIDY